MNQAATRTSIISTTWLYTILKPVIAPFVITRAIILMLALVLQWLLDTGKITHFAFIGNAPFSVLSDSFDSNWFSSIAYGGYDFTTDPSMQSNIHFMPLFPLFMRVIGTITGLGGVAGGYNLAGVFINHLAFLACLILIYKLTLEVWHNEELATRTVWLTAFLPWSFVFSLAYTEGLFLALSLGAILVAYRARLRPEAGPVLYAGLLAAFASLTRHQGVFIACCVAWLVAVVPINITWPARIRNALLAGVPAAVAFASYVLYVGLNLGKPLIVFSAHDAWGKGYLGDLHRIFELPPANPAWTMDIIETVGLVTWVLASIAALVMLVIHRKSKTGAPTGDHTIGLEGWAFAGYVVVSIAYLLIAHTANQSWGRYMMVVFPCIWAIAWLLKTVKLRTLAILMLPIQCIFFAGMILAQATP